MHAVEGAGEERHEDVDEEVPSKAPEACKGAAHVAQREDVEAPEAALEALHGDHLEMTPAMTMPLKEAKVARDRIGVEATDSAEDYRAMTNASRRRGWLSSVDVPKPTILRFSNEISRRRSAYPSVHAPT